MVKASVRRSAPALVAPALSCLLGLLLLVPGAGVAWAHAGLAGSEPLDGEAVPTSPARVQLRFDQPVAAEYVSTALTTEGRTIPITAPSVVSSTVTQPVPDLAPGAYVLAFRVISQDGHPVAGDMKFYVDPTARQLPGVAPGRTSGPDQEAGIGTATWLWVLGVGLVLLVSVVVLVRRVDSD